MAADINDSSAMDVDPSPELQSESEDDGRGAEADRSTVGQCKNCHADIGEFFNSWLKVTGSYYLPVMVGSYQLVSLQTGKPRSASSKSSLSEW